MMRTSTIVTLVFAALLAGAAFHFSTSKKSSINHIPREVHEAYSKWKLTHGKLNASPQENEFRLGVFYETYLHVNKVNAEQNDFVLELNRFSDMTMEEFHAKYTGDLSDSDFEKYIENAEEMELSDIPPLQQTSDWSSVLPPVRNQRSCGGCWAFASTAAFEGAYYKTKRVTLNTSEQMLIDCDTASMGCNGGGPSVNFLQSVGVALDSAYPYQARQGTCNYSGKQLYKATGQVYKTNLTPSTMKSAVMDRPGYISVYVDANFRNYRSGVLKNPLSHTQTNHAITAVGYGADYIKVRNSWDTTWGESGHVRMYLEASGMGTNNMYKRFASSSV